MSKNTPLSDLVFLQAGEKEPYTTDEIIAECARVERSTVSRLVRNHENDLEFFGKVGFEIRAVEGSATGQKEKLYHLNEQQATLLITYLRNTAPVKAFKKALVREFYAMRAELAKRKELRTEGKPQRRTLTDLIQANPDHNKWDFKLYTDLAYRAALGKTAAQIKRDRAPGSSLPVADLLSADELIAYQKQEAAISVLYAAGIGYEAMKPLFIHEKKR